MKPVLKMLKSCVLLLAFAGLPTGSQAQNLVLSVSNSTSAITISNNLTFTLNVTNQTSATISNLSVSYAPLDLLVDHVSATASMGTTTKTDTNFVFNLGNLATNGTANMTVTVAPLTRGTLTNIFAAFSQASTNLAQTNVVVQVLSLPTDLAVTLRVSRNIVVNDWITYSVRVTNLGPNAIDGVILTNSGSADIRVISISPTNLTGVFTNGALVLNLGTLASGAFQNFNILVQPKTAGTNSLVSTVGAVGLADTNPTNNTASASFLVADYLPSQLNVSLVSPTQTFNPITGLMEQSIRITNSGASFVPALRVAVTNLQYWLFNAIGTNSAPDGTNGLPHVTQAAGLAPGSSVDLLMEYFVPTGLPFAISANQFLVGAIPAPDWSPIELGLQVTFSRQPLQMPSGAMLVEFPATPGRSYTIVYSDNTSFSNARIAPPAIPAGASRKQWIDYGPPKTVSSPANGGSRFYKVYLNSEE